jgi:RNA polymerase sigma-70 factor (ECF subfamily)
LHKTGDEPKDAAEWTEFHQHVDALPDEEKEVVNLLWYEGLTQEEAGKLLGISLRTVKRRWHSARTKLYEALANDG